LERLQEEAKVAKQESWAQPKGVPSLKRQPAQQASLGEGWVRVVDSAAKRYTPGAKKHVIKNAA
jgi:hypothetical protein